MQLCVASSSLVSTPVIEALLEAGHTIVSIITNPDKEKGRGKKVEANELALWAQERGLSVAKPADVSELNRHLLDAQPQIVVTVAYGRLIPVELLHGPRFGWINLHFSVLPAWRGAAPVQWSLLNGDRTTGFTIFKLDKGMDTGPYYVQEEVMIEPTDTTETLLESLGARGARAIVELLLVIGKTRATPQPTTGISLAPKISKDMARIVWSDPTEMILRKFRALEVRPGTWSTFRGERISLFGAQEYFGENTLIQVGEIAEVNSQLLVRTSDSVISISEVTPAGKKRMSGSDFVRGARLAGGELFE